MTAITARINMPDNMFLENSMGIFHLVLPLISADRGATVGQDLREKLMQAFRDFEKQCFAMSLDTGMTSDAKYALAAFVDERVMSSAWPHKLSWMGKPLQLEYFGDNLAGEGFYQKLSKLRHGGDRNIDVLEVFYLCLQLGFEGMYRMRGLEQLQALQVDLRTQIADSRNRIPRELSPHGVSKSGFMNKGPRDLPYWAIAAICISVILLAYILFVILLGNKADAARMVLEEDGQRLSANLEQDANRKSRKEFSPPVKEAPRKEPSPPVKEAPRKVKSKPQQPKPVNQAAPEPKPEPKPEPVPEPKPVPKPKAKPAPEPEPKPKPKVVAPIMGF